MYSLQSGFIVGDSTVNSTNVFVSLHFVRPWTLEKKFVLSSVTSAKRNDRVWHTGLIHKLETACVTGEALEWFRNYLGYRTSTCVVLPWD